MRRWLMNMPVSPEKDTEDNYSQAWLDWVGSRHPENTEHHVGEWTKFLEGKTIGEPRTQARPASEYQAMGWVGIYDDRPSITTKEVHKTLKVQ